MEIDLNELERLAKAATPGLWVRQDFYSSGTRFGVDGPNGEVICASFGAARSADYEHIAAANPAVVLELVRRLRTAESEAVKSERRAIEYGDIVHQFTIAMRAAVVAGKLEGLEQGLQWIANTLEGPGHLPNLDEARAIGGAQAMFDAEMAEHEAFRAAHPAPAIQPPKG